MNKSLKEKILFITGGVITVFGLVFFQQKFPTSLDGSKFLAQVPGENTYEECISDPSQIIQNGDLSQLTDFAVGPWFQLSEQGTYAQKEVCFFEGVGFANVLYDPIIQSNALRLFYIRHVFDGNPDYLLFNASEPTGTVQYIDMEPGDYQINFKARVEQEDDKPIMMYVGFSDSVIQRPYPYFPDGCYLQTVDLGNSSNPFARLGIFQECVLDQFDHYTQVLIDSTSYEDYVANISITSPDINYVYFLPFGPEEDWLVEPWVNIKPFAHIFMDDISIDITPFTCGVTFSGEGQLLYNNLQNEYVPYLGGNLNIEEIGNTAPSNVDEELFYMYSPVPGYLNIKAPNNVEYETQDILDLFSVSGGEIISATVFSGGNFWIEYECFESCEDVPEDFNQDGIVDNLDVEFFMNFFGQLCSSLESCPFDFDGNGIITVQDLMILMGSVGQQCGVPLSGDVPDQVDDQNSDQNDLYQSNGNFVKPSKIPGLQKTYNYIVNTKILNTKQSSLQIQNFFPKKMTLRGLYSSTKDISLVSKEGIVNFFNLGKTTNIQSYLYLQASDEVCVVISKNKKAYEEVVSYGICK